MKTQSNPRLLSRVQTCARAASWFVMALAGVVLLGWAFHIQGFKMILPGEMAMLPNTALVFVLMSFSLALLRIETSGVFQRRAGKLCALAGLLFAALTLGEYLFGGQLGIDTWLFPEAVIRTKAPFPGRPSFLTALNFSSFGLALL